MQLQIVFVLIKNPNKNEHFDVGFLLQNEYF